MIVWVIAGLLGLATGLRIGWALVNKQSLVSTAMILALGSLGLVAALNWQPLTLLIDTALHWPNIAMGFSQVALIACAAGSCVMITTVSSERTPATVRKIAIAQYIVAGAIAVASLATSSGVKKRDIAATMFSVMAEPPFVAGKEAVTSEGRRTIGENQGLRS